MLPTEVHKLLFSCPSLTVTVWYGLVFCVSCSWECLLWGVDFMSNMALQISFNLIFVFELGLLDYQFVI